MKKSLFGLVALSLFLSPAAFAQKANEKVIDSVVRVKAPKPEDFPVLKKISELGGKDNASHIQFDYLGKQFDVDMWLVSGDKMMQTIHVLPSGAAIIGGTLASPEGQDVSAAIRQQFATANPQRTQAILQQVQKSMQDGKEAVVPVSSEVAKAPTSSGEVIWERMAQLGIAHYGATKDTPVVYLVMDPMNDLSKQAFDTLEPFAAKDKIDLRVVPVTLKSSEAIMDVALVLASTDPAAALKKVMDGQKMTIDGKEPPKPEGAIALKMNADFVDALKLNAFPTLFYRFSDKDPIRVVKGAPKDWSNILKELGLE